MSFKITTEQQLNDLFTFDEVIAALLVRIDGVILFSKLPPKVDVTIVNAISWIQETTMTMAIEIQLGNLKKVIFEMKNFNVVFHASGLNTLLVVITKTNINFGLMMIEIARRARLLAKSDAIM